ncbi:MAG: hypothetical protein JSV24_09625 [Bacteroidales bacterium]|nr:MAG: hypothetical protein JSV24_09625 [Bacteroidales bacterium]
MEENTGKGFSKIIQSRRIKFDRKLIVFLFFLLLSTIFWLLNELSKNSTTTITYPVMYTNLPRDKVLVREMPSRFDLLIEAPGFTLLKYTLSNRLVPLVFDLNAYSPRILSNASSEKYFILTSSARERIGRQLRSDVRILAILPDSLIMEFGDIVSKTVPVIPDLNIEFSKQYMLSGEIMTTPDSIIVSGPDVIIDTLRQVYTKHLDINQMNQTETRDVSIESIKNVTFSHKKVDVTIPIEQFTEAVLEVPIEKLHVPDSLVLKTFPGTITLACMVSLSNYDKLSPHLFRAVVDYEGIENNLSNKLKVSITKAPDYIRSVRFHPVNVEFIIEK